MFSEKDDTVIDYNQGSRFNSQPLNFPYRLKQKFSQNLLIAGYSLIRANCEEACSLKMLADASDEDKAEIRNNSKISQIHLKTRDDELQKGFDSCIRRCFVQRCTEHFGKEAQDYIYATAFEYQQQDFHYLDINPIHKHKRNPKLNFPQSDYTVADSVIGKFNI